MLCLWHLLQLKTEWGLMLCSSAVYGDLSKNDLQERLEFSVLLQSAFLAICYLS